MAKRAYNVVVITPENIQKLDEKERIVYDVVQRLALDNHIKMPEV
jgi:hypothetical protein